jgi:hypothetical protein
MLTYVAKAEGGGALANTKDDPSMFHWIESAEEAVPPGQEREPVSFIVD